jgi:uncharacterized protein
LTGIAYLDASALVKLIVDEPESTVLHRWYVEAERLLSSRIGVVETIRATSRRPVDAAHRDRILSDLEVVEVTATICATAAAVHPPLLRTLDAIHLASALAVGPELDALVTYDDRLAEAARAIGLPVVRPA